MPPSRLTFTEMQSAAVGSSANAWDLLGGKCLDPQDFLKQVPKLSEKSSKGHDFTYYWDADKLLRTWTPKVCKIMAFWAALGQYFTYFGGPGRRPTVSETRVCSSIAGSSGRFKESWLIYVAYL